MIELKKCPVVFHEDTHTYDYEGRQLKGITKIIKERLFPDEYANVPDYILQKAADFGHKIHSDIELYDNGVPIESEYVDAYENLKLKNNLINVCNEYLVSDLNEFASSIDIVMQRGDEIILVDTKTTYNLNRDYVAWQLSVYKYFFELQNPDLKVSSIMVLWYKIRKEILEDTELIDLSDNIHSEEDVKNLLYSDNFQVEVKNNDNVVCPTLMDELLSIERNLKELNKRRDTIKEQILDVMVRTSMKSVKFDNMTITLKDSSVRSSLDSKSLKKDLPDVYEKYVKNTSVSPSLLITLK